MSSATSSSHPSWLKPALGVGAIFGVGATIAAIASLPDVPPHPVTAHIERMIAVLRYGQYSALRDARPQEYVVATTMDGLTASKRVDVDTLTRTGCKVGDEVSGTVTGVNLSFDVGTCHPHGETARHR